MILQDTKVLRGPNYWSNYRQNLIVIKLDIQEFEHRPTNQIEGFNEHLVVLIPSLQNHHCSEGRAGGFIERLNQGILLGHVIEHVALELQQLVGIDVNFGRTRSANQKGVYYILFSYEIENAGLYAAKAAIRLVDALANGKYYKFLEKDLKRLKKINSDEGFGPSTNAIISAAKKRNIPFKRLEDNSIILLGQGANQQIISAAVTSKTSLIAAEIASDKALTKQMLLANHIPVPQGLVVKNLQQLNKAIKEIDFPLVIKPINGNHGRGITINIKTAPAAINAFKLAKQISNEIVVERFIEGNDYRFLVINKKIRAVGKRTAAFVTGNGESTINQLIEIENADERRGEDHEKMLTKITVDDATLAILLENNLSLESVLPPGKILYLKYAANVSAGGTSTDVTDHVHPYNIELAERIARLSGLDICGIDIIAKDIQQPLDATNGAIIEVNAGPGLRMHTHPTEGTARNVAEHILDYLYPENKSSRIPIVAITGTNGKTTVARLIAKFASEEGYHVGFTTTDGIYVDNTKIVSGDCAGPLSAGIILRDPLVNFAILECARGGIIRSGLGFDKCNISIVTNISEDHLGIDDIDTLEDLARVKEVVPRSTFKDGWAILNADDEIVYSMKDNLTCHVALFSIHPDNENIKKWTQMGGMAAYVENNILILEFKNDKEIIANMDEIACRPLLKNILPAILAGKIAGFSITNMQKVLQQFLPSAENTPGRMNLIKLPHCSVLVDYAHNVEAFYELKNYLNTLTAKKIIGIVGVPGDRRDVDIEALGYLSAQMFDEIIIRHDKDSRGRSNQQITDLLQTGINRYSQELNVSVISDGLVALENALKVANEETLIVFVPEDVVGILNYLKNYAFSAKNVAPKNGKKKFNADILPHLKQHFPEN